MSSPIYTAFLSSTTIFSLPLELAEEILISCALAGSVEAIASFSQTCRLYHELIYGGADNHLWRGIYLATFDDPRPRLRTLRRPISDAVAEEVAFDWKTEYQLQIRAGKLFRGSIVDSRFLYSTLNALSSTALPPHFPRDSFPRESSNIAWLDNVLSRGFPSTLLHRLTLSKSDIIKLSQQDIMHPDWERSAAGRAFYKLFFLTGLHVNATSEHRDEEERYQLRSKTREIQQSSLTEAKQRAMARTVARHRVYNLPYLSAERCWGPFLPIGYSPPPPDDELDSHTSGSETDKGKAREISVEDPQATPAEEPPRWPRQKGRGRSAESSLAQVDMSSVRAILTNFDEHDLQFMDEDEDVDPDYVPTHYLTESDTEIHSSDDENDTEQDHIVGSFFFTDQDAEDGEDPLISARGSFPVFPQRPDLVYPDWAFLSAARLVITENLRERYGNDIPMWPWFTTVAAVQATREILLRMGVSLPQNLKTDRTAEEIDGDEDVDDEEDIDRAKTSNDTPHESRSPIEALRMGSAPGFWAGRGTKEGWTGIASDEQERELSKPWKIDKDVEFVDGWDWAGAEGRWMRAVCWMDYRDLLFHNLQTNYPTIGYRHEIEETCRVFPMTLRVVGFSRVSPPLALPPSSSSPKPSSKSPPSSKAKGKGKATDHGYADSSYDPLVYALPIIHIVGEFRGSDVDESVARRARGTIRMIGDRAIRWNLISSEVSTPDRDEWVMEGVQVGEIGSAMGVVGMWTGAQHERGDPIGPSWAWKME